jgi:broad specificity phosphatase PhoE
MLWLVRHGQSVANAGGITADYDNIPLTDLGRLQSEAFTAACLEAPNWIGLSPYLRARETAAPLLARFPAVPTFDLDVHEFTYLATGRCDGMDSATRQPLVDAYWSRLDPDYCDGIGAESFASLMDRAEAFLNWASGQVSFGIVFTHEQFIRAVLVAAMHPFEKPTVSLMRRFFALRSGMPIPNAAIVRLQHGDGRWWFGGVDVAYSVV